jgi:hypothetical protein
MDLDDHDIQQFIRLWKVEFKEVLSPADARECASSWSCTALSHYHFPTDTSPVMAKKIGINSPCDTSFTAGNRAKMKTAKSSQ